MEADKGGTNISKGKKAEANQFRGNYRAHKRAVPRPLRGDLERWFDHLCPDSIYLGTSEPMLFGGSAIREHFKGFEGNAVDGVSEEYYPVPLGETAAQVCGRLR